jgi:hypothetical protein
MEDSQTLTQKKKYISQIVRQKIENQEKKKMD